MTTRKRTVFVLAALGIGVSHLVAQRVHAQELAATSAPTASPAQGAAVTPYDVWLLCRLPFVAEPNSIPPAGVNTSDVARARALCGPIDSLSAHSVTVKDLGGTLPTAKGLKDLLTSSRAAAHSTSAAPSPVILDTLSAQAGIVFFRNAATLPQVVEDRVRVIGRQIREYITAHPKDSVVIVGTADAVGTLQYNAHLASQRAEYLKTVIAQEGVPLQNLKTYACPTPRYADVKLMSSLVDSACAHLHPGIVGTRHSGVPSSVLLRESTIADRSSPIAVALPLGSTEALGPSARVDSVTARAPTLDLSPDGLASALANEVISTAESDVENDAFTQASFHLCGTVGADSDAFRPRTYLELTCAMMDSLRKADVVTSMHDVQTHLESDLWRAPQSISRYVLAHGPDNETLQTGAAIFLSAIGAVRDRRLSNDPWLLLSRTPFLTDSSLRRSRSEIVGALVVLGEVANGYRNFEATVPNNGTSVDALDARGALGAAARAFLVNVTDSAVDELKPLRSSTASVPTVGIIAAARRVTALEVQTRGSTAASIQPETVVNTLAQVAHALLPDSGAKIVDSVSVIAIDVDSDLRAGKYVPALGRVSDFGTTAGEGSGKLSAYDMRAMAFAAALADARDQSAVSAAVHEFVHGGNGYRGKRLRPFADDTVVAASTPPEAHPKPPSDVCPVQGRFSALRGCRQYWTINSYLGLAVSGEHPYGGVEAPNRVQGSYYLPIGVEVGGRPAAVRADARTSAVGRSAGVFFQMLDLGSIAAMRLSTHPSSSAPSSATQFISPGVFVTWSWKSDYWSGLVGVSYSPAAQRVNGSRDLSALRVTFVPLSVDVPLFP